jgi:hypothetical protein
MLAVIAVINTPLANADLQPDPCAGPGVSLSMQWLREDNSTNVLLSNSPITNQPSKVDIGETLYLRATLDLANPEDCNYVNGTLFITTPDLVAHELSMQVPTISNVTSFTNSTGPYVVSAFDDDASCDGSVDGLNNTKLTSCAFYGNESGAPFGAEDGVSHSSTDGEDPARQFVNSGVNFVLQYNATTQANVTGSQDNPVATPLDIVTITADSNFIGNFTGNFTLGNSTNVFETGDCTEGTVNGTGIATLECQASGTYDTPVGNTCFDVTINAPSPYAPSEFTLFGADDSENECFSITPPSWNATTLSNVTGSQGASVIDPLDVVTIVANQNFTGTFDGNFTLGNSTDVFDAGICTGGAVNATTGNATLNCAASATIEAIDGITCFDVTINAPSPYDPSEFTLFGSDDSENECFVVNPPEWNATTQSNVTGAQIAPVVDPLDVVTIVANENFTGTFDGNFTLGNSTDVFDTGICTGGAVNATTGEATLNCQAIGTFDNTIGDTCFDVTINAPSPYAPSEFTLFGADDSQMSALA